jgi:hypothetical protein
MSRRRLALWCGLFLLAAAPTRADQLIMGVEQSITAQSNIFRLPENRIADGTYELTPVIRLRRPESKFSYDIRYAPSFEVFFKTNGINGFDHLFRSDFGYRATPNASFALSADVADYRANRATGVDGATGIPDVTPGARGRITRVFSDLSYEHRLGPVTNLVAGVGLQSYDYTTPNNVDSLGFGGEIVLTTQPTQILTLGGSLLASHRGFDERDLQPSSRNTILNPNLIVQIQPFSTVRLDLRGGPGWVFSSRSGQDPVSVSSFSGAETSQGTVARVFDVSPASANPCDDFSGQAALSTCPLAPAPALTGRLGEETVVFFDPGQNPGSSDDDFATWFLSAELRKDFAWGHVSLNFLRAEDASSGSGSTTVRDSLTGELAFERGRWSTRLRANWNQRLTTTNIDQSLVRAGASTVPTGTGLFYAEANGLIPNAVTRRPEITQYWVDARVIRRIMDSVELELGITYLHQERREAPGVRTKFDNVTGNLSFRYTFRPIEYWTR